MYKYDFAYDFLYFIILMENFERLDNFPLVNFIMSNLS